MQTIPFLTMALLVTSSALAQTGTLGASSAASPPGGAANIGITDAVSLLDFLFASGPTISSPFGGCGVDPTADLLGCTAFADCS